MLTDFNDISYLVGIYLNLLATNMVYIPFVIQPDGKLDTM